MTVAPARHWTGILVAASAFAAMSYMPLNIMPLMLGSAADTFGLSNTEIGDIGSAFLLGFTVLSLTAFFWIQRFNWRVVLIVTSVAVALGFASFTIVSETIKSLLFWSLLGFCAAAPYTVIVRILSDAANTNRAFGAVTAVQIGSSAVLLWLLPNFFMRRWGFDSIVVALALGFLLVAPGAFLVPASSATAEQDARQPLSTWFTRQTLPIWLVLAGAFIFISGQIGLWAFLERIGHHRGIATGEIGTILAILKIIGALSGLTMFLLGTRVKGWVPHVACTAMVALGAVLLAIDTDGRYYAIGAWIWEYGYSLYYVYLYAYIAVIDHTHRLVVLTPAAITCGAAIGPFIAGRLAQDGNYVPVLIFAAISIAVPALLMSSRPAIRIEQDARQRVTG